MKKLSFCLLGAAAVLAGCNGVGNLDQGQVKYTPGVPPWQEKDASKRGPGAAPGGGGPGGNTPPAQGSSQGQAAAGPNSNQPPPGGGPPGMTAPDRGMGGN